ncbi:MAG: carbohydrate ABC transporter permease [Spirochaetales bacterium]|nr:carbohydrate ABC transporter permease [Spirochaetales bacterium]
MNREKLQIYRMRRRIGIGFDILFKIAVIIIFTFPFYWMLITSMKTYLDSIKFPPSMWPSIFDFTGYEKVFRDPYLVKYIWNTIIITVAIMLIEFVTVIPCSYALAKYDFMGNSIVWVLIMAAKMIPTVITFIPVYIMFAKWRVGGTNVLNTLWPQILPFGTSAFNIFLLRQNFKQIPEEIIESARLDNASELKIMYRVMLPMAKSTIITILLLTFISHWNAYFWPLVMTNTKDLQPIAVAIARLKEVEHNVIYWPKVMAGCMVMTAPVLILFFGFSKKIIASMAYRGVK